MPAFNLRPGSSAQYVMAIRNFDKTDGGDPLRFRFGFMGSSDNHFARAGTGYKEVHRRGFTESRDWGQSETLSAFGPAPRGEPVAQSKPFDRENTDLVAFQLFEMERQSSYFQTGGLIAAHSAGRDRGAIWDPQGAPKGPKAPPKAPRPPKQPSTAKTRLQPAKNLPRPCQEPAKNLPRTCQEPAGQRLYPRTFLGYTGSVAPTRSQIARCQDQGAAVPRPLAVFIEPVSKCMESVFLERADSVAGCTQVFRLGAKLVAP